MQQLHISYYTGYYKIFCLMPEMYINIYIYIYIYIHTNIHTHKFFLRLKGYAKWRISVFPWSIIMELQHCNISFTWLHDQQYAITYIPQFKYGAQNATETY